MAKVKIEIFKPFKPTEKASGIKNKIFTPVGVFIIAAVLLLIVLILIQYWSKEYGSVFEEKIIELRELQEQK